MAPDPGPYVVALLRTARACLGDGLDVWFEGGGLPDAVVRDLGEAVLVSARPSDIRPGTLWPKPVFVGVAVTEVSLEVLRLALDSHALSEIAIHLHGTADGRWRFSWHDLGCGDPLAFASSVAPSIRQSVSAAAGVLDTENEWCFEIRLRRPDDPQDAISDPGELLMESAIEWAEAHELGIGGGYGPPERGPGGSAVDFHFGLCATREGQIIPASQAESLLRQLRDAGRVAGGRLEGGWRAFTADGA